MDLCSTTFLMVSANIPATEMIFIFGDCRFNGMESVKINLLQSGIFNFFHTPLRKVRHVLPPHAQT